MPEPNRPPVLIEDGLGGLPFWMLIEQRAIVVMECEACHHRREWTAETMERLFSQHRGKTLSLVADKLRCGECKSDWVWISRDYKRRPAAPSSPAGMKRTDHDTR